MSIKTQIFLTSIGPYQKESFKNKFIENIDKNNTNIKNNVSIPVWNFTLSLKNLEIWKNINKNDWILFYFNGRYSFASKIHKKEKSKRIAKEIFGVRHQDKHLLIFCKEIFEIKQGFTKCSAGSDMKTQLICAVVIQHHQYLMISSNSQNYFHKCLMLLQCRLWYWTKDTMQNQYTR